MAKISPVSIKYMIYAKFEAEGTLEKPDVIGAVFGQTEGLLGDELEMRDLQKEGKIGRIEVTLETKNGKTIGEIQIPSALDKAETTLIAAAVETIERIGPSTAKIEIDKIEDVRENKRSFILERAKKLLEGIEDKMPKTKELASDIKRGTREARIKEYGEDKLPAGNIESKEIIVVEGRADVLNLLRNNIDNVIGMDGTKLPRTIKELSYDKEITLFLDGDRGGVLIAKNVIDNARIDYIAIAPDGKEVEELSGKEILVALRKKISADEFLRKFRGFRKQDREEDKPQRLKIFDTSTLMSMKSLEKVSKEQDKPAEEEASEETELDKNKLEPYLKQVEGTKSILLLDKKLEVIDRIQARGIFSSLDRTRGKAYVLVTDKATPIVIDAAEKYNIKNIVARNFTYFKETSINLISL